MNLVNLTQKDKELYEIAMERKKNLIVDLTTVLPKESVVEVLEIIHHISRAEYKRGKADGIAETKFIDELDSK